MSEDDLVIENIDEMMNIVKNEEIDFSSFINSIYEKMFIFNTNSAEVQIVNNFISIKNFETFDFTLNEKQLSEKLTKIQFRCIHGTQ